MMSISSVFICWLLGLGGCVGGLGGTGFRFRQVGGNLSIVKYWRLRLGQVGSNLSVGRSLIQARTWAGSP